MHGTSLVVGFLDAGPGCGSLTKSLPLGDSDACGARAGKGCPLEAAPCGDCVAGLEGVVGRPHF